MPAPVPVELLVVGNELLTGEIQDANVHFLCKTVGALGGRVLRATLLRDELDAVAAELRAAASRARVVFTSGGLGPTADDLTLSAVARAAGVELRLHPGALQMVRDRYDELAAGGVLAQGGLTPEREKMAWLPSGAAPLRNPIGTAPGVLFTVGPTSFVSLPGIPRELRAILDTSLGPFLKDVFGGGLSVARTVMLDHDETLIAPVLTRVARRHPEVHVKSLVSTSSVAGLRVTLTTVGSGLAVLEALVDGALRDLEEELASLGATLPSHTSPGNPR